ncbi:MAG: hypothetical protein LRY74_18890 [Shewanella xiamenensis]|nr:hypothetical protein [Shewanella xiamenensis]
MVTIAIAALL